MITDTILLAATATQKPPIDPTLIMLILMMGIFYFVLIRPQRRKEKARRAMLDAAKSGDRIMFGGGLIGTITNTKEDTVTVKIADNVKIDVARAGINKILGKDEKVGDPNQA